MNKLIKTMNRLTLKVRNKEVNRYTGKSATRLVGRNPRRGGGEDVRKTSGSIYRRGYSSSIYPVRSSRIILRLLTIIHCGKKQQIILNCYSCCLIHSK